MNQDIQRKLNDMGFKADVVSEILSHIFGIKSDPTFFEWLVDCQSESGFDSGISWNYISGASMKDWDVHLIRNYHFLIGLSGTIQNK